MSAQVASGCRLFCHRCLLGSNLGFHLLPCRQNHLVAALLQESLPLVLVGAPFLCRGLRRLLAILLRYFVLKIVPLYQVRLGRLINGPGGATLRCR